MASPTTLGLHRCAGTLSRRPRLARQALPLVALRRRGDTAQQGSRSQAFKPWTSAHPDSWFSCGPGANGFLPVGTPLARLPPKYDQLNKLLDDMRIVKEDGQPGLLAQGTLGDTVHRELPVMDVSEETSIEVLAALHRDFSFLASAYTFEPAHQRLSDGQGVYGQARQELPPQLAEPLVTLGGKLNVYPWLDYAYGYGLNNAVLTPGADPLQQTSFTTCRMFHGHPSESGFINVHVVMVSQTGELLRHQQSVLRAAAGHDFAGLQQALNSHNVVFNRIVGSLQTMWGASKPKEYLGFRTFIMGQTGNTTCFPAEEMAFHRADGTIEKHSYRGETGAQDSILPSIDNLLQLKYPKNKLTAYLFDLRSYRPPDHTGYIDYNRDESARLGLKAVVYQHAGSTLALLRNLDTLRQFRAKHWNLTKAYIIRNTKHETATGGTPITTWLPNLLGATLEYEGEAVNVIDNHLAADPGCLSPTDKHDFYRIKVELTDHVQRLMEEVTALQSDFQKQEVDSFRTRTESSREGIFEHTHRVAMQN